MSTLKGTVLYFGGAGFVGEKVVNLLRKKYRKRKIVVYDNFSLTKFGNLPKSVDTIVGGVKSPSSIKAALTSIKPETIIYGVGPAWLAEDINISEEAYHKNVVGLLNLCRNLRELPDVPKRIILLSDLSVYNSGSELKEEQAEPQTPVGQSFLFAEELLKMYCSIRKIDYTILRIPCVYGRGAHCVNDIVSFLVNCVLDGVNFTIFGTKGTIRDFVYIDDLADNLVKVIDNLDITGTYNFGGQHVSMVALAEEIKKRLNKKCEYVLGHPEFFKYSTVTLDYSKIEDFNIEFNVLIRDVLGDLIEKIKKERKNEKKFEL